jgi:hypothetical protein
MTITTYITHYLDGKIDYVVREYFDLHGTRRVVTEVYVETSAGVFLRVDRAVHVRQGDGSADAPIYVI